MSNLVFLYTGNVGSTPLVQLAGRHTKVFSPAHEEFDAYMFEKAFPEDPDCEALSGILDRLFKRESDPYFDLDDMRARRDADALPSKENVPHLLFKWRMDNATSPRAVENLRTVFSRHAVIPVVLARRSIVRQALKIHLSEVQYGRRHQQFRASALSAEEYETYLRDQEAVSVRIDAEALVRCREIASGFLHRTKAIISRAAEHFEATPRLVLSEQMLRPELDHLAISGILSTLFEEPITLSPDMEPTVRRAGLGVRHCSNPETVAGDRVLRRIEHRYQMLLRKVPLVSGAHAPVPLAAQIKGLFSPPVVPLRANVASPSSSPTPIIPKMEA